MSRNRQASGTDRGIASFGIWTRSAASSIVLPVLNKSSQQAMTPLSEKVEEGFGLSEIVPEDNPSEATSKEAVRSRRHRGGRPKKPESERRRHKYLVSANDAERAAIEAAAEAASLAPSAYLREAGVGGDSGGRIERRTVEVLYHKLSRIGVHLQTLAGRMAERDEVEDADTLEKLVGDVVELRSRL